jgi:hypothetical protein
MGVSCFTVGNIKADLHMGSYQRFIFGDPVLPEPLARFSLDNIYVPILGSPSFTNFETRNNTLSGFRWIHTTNTGDTFGELKLQSFVNAEPTGTDILVVGNTGILTFVAPISFSNLSITGDLDLNSHKIVNLAPPVNSTDAATKGYVDSHEAGMTWVDQTSSTTMLPNTYYVANSSSLLSFALPTTANFGDVFHVTGKGSGGWIITQNAGQQINFGDVSTTLGTSGYLENTNPYDSVTLVCVAANTAFVVYNCIGNVTYY